MMSWKRNCVSEPFMLYRYHLLLFYFLIAKGSNILDVLAEMYVIFEML